MRTVIVAVLTMLLPVFMLPVAIVAGDPASKVQVKEIGKTVGDTIYVLPGGFADVKVSLPDGASVIWRITPTPIQRANNLPAGRIIFGGVQGKTYFVTAIIVDFNTKTVTDSEQTVVFGGTDPGPNPNPPVIDPLVDLIQAVYGSDTSPSKAEDKTKLAAVYKAVAEQVNAITTAGDLFAVIRSSTEDRIAGRLKPIRSVFGGELEKVLPDIPSAPLTADHRAKVINELNRFAGVLGKVQ